MIQSYIDCASDSEETTPRWFIVHYLWYILGWCGQGLIGNIELLLENGY